MFRHSEAFALHLDCCPQLSEFQWGDGERGGPPPWIPTKMDRSCVPPFLGTRAVPVILWFPRCNRAWWTTWRQRLNRDRSGLKFIRRVGIGGSVKTKHSDTLACWKHTKSKASFFAVIGGIVEVRVGMMQKKILGPKQLGTSPHVQRSAEEFVGSWIWVVFPSFVRVLFAVL